MRSPALGATGLSRPRHATSWLMCAALLGGFACAGGSKSTAKSPNESANATATHDERLVYRRAVGGLGAGYLFQTHVSIGTTADLLGRRAYEPEEVEALMGTMIGMGKSVDEMLSGLRAIELGPSDQETLTQMRDVNRMLGEQATALSTFARNRTESNAKRFARIRSSTWTRLEKLLRIKPPPAATHGS